MSLFSVPMMPTVISLERWSERPLISRSAHFSTNSFKWSDFLLERKFSSWVVCLFLSLYYFPWCPPQPERSFLKLLSSLHSLVLLLTVGLDTNKRPPPCYMPLSLQNNIRGLFLSHSECPWGLCTILSVVLRCSSELGLRDQHVVLFCCKRSPSQHPITLLRREDVSHPATQ